MMMTMDDEASMMEDNSSYDATDVFFRRGEFLRKLREMEAQDDAEREQENQAAALLAAATGTVSNAAGMSAAQTALSTTVLLLPAYRVQHPMPSCKQRLNQAQPLRQSQHQLQHRSRLF